MSCRDKQSELSEEEKAKLLSGAGKMRTYEVKRLGIPPLAFSDGPLGIRKSKPNGSATSSIDESLPATCFPSGSNLGNTWSLSLLQELGSALGKEARHYGVDILLGPSLNIKRNPHNGRNFEYYSEDPFLNGCLASSYVEGIQGEGVGACLKHFALNNNESFRFLSDSLAGERTMREIYLKPFEIAIKASHPAALMCSYNRVNSIFSAEHPFLLKQVLREEWDYQGLVMSDWGGMRDRVASLKAGLDLEMPGGIDENAKQVQEAASKDPLLQQEEEKSVSRLLKTIDTAQEKREREDRPSLFEEDDELAYRLALESFVLLKNEKNALPLAKGEKVLVLGPLFLHEHDQGGGSSLIHPYKKKSLTDAFREEGIDFAYEEGYQEEEEKPNPRLEKKALEKAKDFSTILLFLGERGTDDSEGYDRASLDLPRNQVSLLERLPAEKRIVVLLYGGGSMNIPSLSKISALLYCGLPGQGGARALAQLLSGQESPCGKIAESFYLSEADIPYGKEFKPQIDYLYKEGIFVGYRQAKNHPKRFLFPFGYGLSYTSFSYSSLTVERREGDILVSCLITNTGKREGKEISEVYVGKEDSPILRPERELKGFSKDSLKPGESKRIQVKIPLSSLEVYCPARKRWVLEEGAYQFGVGPSSRDLPLQGEVFLKGEALTADYPPKVQEKIESYQLSDEEFFSLLGWKKEKERFDKPYTMETPIAYFQTLGGKCFRKILVGTGKRKIKKAKRIKDPEARSREEKTGTFLAKMLPYNSLRSLSFSSDGVLPLSAAEGILDIVNGHPFRGLKKMRKKKGA